MKSALLALLPNRVRRNYAGGLNLDRWENRPQPGDRLQPEDWLASTTMAVNRGMPVVPAEGLGRICDEHGHQHLLTDLFAQHGEFYLGKNHYNRLGATLGFLAKLLDSSMRLHTQVHPTRDFARTHLNAPYGKLECYVILGIRPGFPGHLRLGFQHPPSRDEWRRIIAQQDIAGMDACFEPIPVEVGQVWWVPGGMVHALGAGLLLLEVMEPSDLVVRCEFEREGIVVPPEARYMGRDLEFCLDVFDYRQFAPKAVTARCLVTPEFWSSSSTHQEILCLAYDKTSCFEVRHLILTGRFAWPASSMGRLVIVALGTGCIRALQQSIALQPGSRFFVAAGAEQLVIVPDDGFTLELYVCQAGHE